jgi:phosphatidylserine decarboxylase
MLSRYGRREWLSTGILCAFLSALSLLIAIKQNSSIFYIICLVLIFMWTLMALFFRDPPRRAPEDGRFIVSPADGVVKDISVVKLSSFPDIEFKRIGIFLSVLDVHINRAPCDMTVKSARYEEGAFHDARSPMAISKNESNTIECEADFNGAVFPVVVKQISGAIARRIVSEALPGVRLKRAERYGMIKFGSRTELYLPNDERFKVLAREGDRVFAGASALAEIQINS